MASLLTSIDKENGTYLPRNEDDVLALVQYALDRKLTLRCKASGHAWPPGIASGRATFEKGFKKDPNALYQVPTSKTGQLNIKLDHMDNNQAIQLTRDEADGIGSNDNDTSIPTSAAVVDYVANNGGDGLLLRSAIGNGATTVAIGTVPNVSSRTYYANKVVIKVSTAFSGNNINASTRI